MKKLIIAGIVCFVLGVLIWGIVAPAMIPSASPSDISGKWQHIAERVSVVSGLAGLISGFGLALVAVALFYPKRIKEEETEPETEP